MNLIFIDTEFTDFEHKELISLGMINYNTKEEYYAEVLDFNDDLSSLFVRENIYPLLEYNKYGRFKGDIKEEAGKWLEKFNNSIIVSDWSGDIKILRKSVNVPKSVGGMVFPFDLVFSSFDFFADEDYGIIQEMFADGVDCFFSESNLNRHHALVDVRANIYSFEKMMLFFSGLKNNDIELKKWKGLDGRNKNFFKFN